MKKVVKRIFIAACFLTLIAAFVIVLRLASKAGSDDAPDVDERNQEYDEYASIFAKFDDERQSESSLAPLEREMRSSPTLEGIRSLAFDQNIGESKRRRYFDKYCDLLARDENVDELQALLDKELAQNPQGSRDADKLRRWVELAEGKRRFNALVGQTLPVEGRCLDGSELDWESYRGKIVVVDVWATSNGRDFAVDDYDSIRAVYDKYRDQGLDVVGYNLDRDVEKIKEMKKGNPWKIVSQRLSELERDEQGAPKYVDLRERYGIESVPTAFLVDRDGKVLATNVAARELIERLKQIFE